jgi:hypothetical protein
MMSPMHTVTVLPQWFHILWLSLTNEYDPTQLTSPYHRFYNLLAMGRGAFTLQQSLKLKFPHLQIILHFLKSLHTSHAKNYNVTLYLDNK